MVAEVVGGTARRWPPLACLGLVLTWLLLRLLVDPTADVDPNIAGRPLAEPLVAYWMAHPELDAPAACAAFTRPHHSKRHQQTLAAIDRHGRGYRPAAGDAEHLDQLCAALQTELGRSGWRRWALIPRFGLKQRGLLSHLLLHPAWMMLCLNALILLLCGPHLERVWAAPMVLALIALGALVAGVAQVLAAGEGSAPLLGGAGAVAACTGAFCLRFGKRRVAALDWLSPRLALHDAAAWTYGVAWLALELARLAVFDGSSGLGFGARLAGFSAGVVAALAIRRWNLETALGLPGAQMALAEAQAQAAQAEEGLAKKPSSSDADAGKDNDTDTPPGVHLAHPPGRFAELRLDTDADDGSAWGPPTTEAERAIWDPGGPAATAAETSALEPVTPEADALNPAPTVDATEADAAVASLLAALADQPADGPVKTSPLAGARLPSAQPTERYSRQPQDPMVEALQEVRREIRRARSRREPPEVLDPGVSINRCHMLGWTPDGLAIECADGRHLNVPPTSIRTIAVGMVQVAATGRAEVLADLIIDGQRPGQRIVLRSGLDDMALIELMPDCDDRRQAWTGLMQRLQQLSGAQTLPEGAPWPGPPLRGFRNEAALDAAFYGL